MSINNVESRTLVGAEHNNIAGDNDTYWGPAPGIDWTNRVYTGRPTSVPLIASTSNEQRGKELYIQQDPTFADTVTISAGLRNDWLDLSETNNLEAKAELTSNRSLTAAYSYLNAEIVENGTLGNEGNRPYDVPEHIASLWVNYTLEGDGGRGDMTFGLGGRYTGSYYFNDEITAKTGSNFVVDAACTYKVFENTSFEVNVSNLFDRKHVDYGGFGADFYNPGRAVYATSCQTW